MVLHDQPSRPRSLAVPRSLRRTLVAALVVTALPVLVVLVLSVPGLTLAFLAGVGSGGVLSALRRRTDRSFRRSLAALHRRLTATRS